MVAEPKAFVDRLIFATPPPPPMPSPTIALVFTDRITYQAGGCPEWLDGRLKCWPVGFPLAPAFLFSPPLLSSYCSSPPASF